MAKKKTNGKPLDKETLRKEYEKLYPEYERLAINTKQALEIFIKEAGIGVLGVYYRIKDFDSFYKKIGRKGYTDPFTETEDICGLRVVCYYESDTEKIVGLVEKEFANVKLIDKSDELEPNQFGYRSIQGSIEIPEEWLNAPNYRGLEGLKAEIQIRSILMHAWAEIEHKLVYTRDGYPKDIDEAFAKISVYLEDADEKFDELREIREKYREDLTEEAEDKGRFDVNQPMNIDTLQALLNYFFPDRTTDAAFLEIVLDDITECNISTAGLVGNIIKVLHILPEVEADYYSLNYDDIPQPGLVRAVLDLTDNDFWERNKSKRGYKLKEFIEKWRTKFAELEK